MQTVGKIVVGGKHKDIEYMITDDGCYEVISHAKRGNTGYHCIKIDGKTLDIHRWLYAKFYNIDLNGLQVRHKCDNRKCINIEHLEHGTYLDNIYDMLERFRYCTKFKKEDILYIVENKDLILSMKVEERRHIAKTYNVTYNVLMDLLSGRSHSYFSHIPKPIKKQRNINKEKHISFDVKNNKFRVIIVKEGKKKHIGRYSTIEEAISARNNSL